jgi:hypothetical protein
VGNLRDPVAFLIFGKQPPAFFEWGWMDRQPVRTLKPVCFPCREWNHDYSDVKPRAKSLYKGAISGDYEIDMFRSKLSCQPGGEACDSVRMRTIDWEFVRKYAEANVKSIGDKASLWFVLLIKETEDVRVDVPLPVVQTTGLTSVLVG